MVNPRGQKKVKDLGKSNKKNQMASAKLKKSKSYTTRMVLSFKHKIEFKTRIFYEDSRTLNYSKLKQQSGSILNGKGYYKTQCGGRAGSDEEHWLLFQAELPDPHGGSQLSIMAVAENLMSPSDTRRHHACKYYTDILVDITPLHVK